MIWIASSKQEDAYHCNTVLYKYHYLATNCCYSLCFSFLCAYFGFSVS